MNEPSEAAMRVAREIIGRSYPAPGADVVISQIIDRVMADDVYQILSVKRGREILDLEARNKELVEALEKIIVCRYATEVKALAIDAIAKGRSPAKP